MFFDECIECKEVSDSGAESNEATAGGKNGRRGREEGF